MSINDEAISTSVEAPEKPTDVHALEDIGADGSRISGLRHRTRVASSYGSPAWSYVQWLLVFSLAVFAFWLYYPALSLPLSLIDDYVKLNNLDRVIKDFGEGGLYQVVQNDISIVNRTYNLGFYLLTALNFRLSGGQPFHWLKLLEMAVVTILMFSLLRRTLAGNRLSWLAAFLSVLVFLIADVPAAIDLHGLRVNWYRLFATDADGVFFLAVHAYCLFEMLRTSKRPVSLLWAVPAFAAGFMAATIKIPYVALVLGPLCALGTAAFFLKTKGLAVKAVTLAVITGVTFTAFYLVMRNIALSTTNSDGAYGQGFSLGIKDIWEGFYYYVDKLWIMLGPLLPAVIGLCTTSCIYLWRLKKAEGPLPFLILIYFMVFTLLAVSIYAPWLHRLPRYMLPASFGLSLLTGIGFYCAGRLFREGGRTAFWQMCALTAGISATLLPPKVLLLLLIATALMYLIFRYKVAVQFVAGVGLVGLGYILATSPLQRSAINNFYVGREFANWQATLLSMKLIAEGDTIYYAGETADEHIGSMAGHISRFGINPDIKTTADLDPNLESTQTVVLVHRHLSPPNLAEEWASSPVIAELNVPKSPFKVPVSFWEFRRRLLHHAPDEPLLYDQWHSDYVWRFYREQ